ncbi:FIG139991: Putative thiamine pyrophosphate-requiring enzyme [plant metagenome]|uniref:FIG139991: Putative thiamine pyrophosphate-requiring enzyme n=1 Tax=plant metagenome TaxID=1297885 RepID=A0A484PSH3_9ZZZZ
MMLNLSVALIALAGFVCLALAAERQGEQLLGRVPMPAVRRGCRTAGWLLLGAALLVCLEGWGDTIGGVAWVAWIGVVSAVLAFALPRWTEKPARPLPIEATAPLSASRRWLAAVVLCAVPVAFGIVLAQAPVKPVLRDDALHGEIGPWTFSLAEADLNAPQMILGETPFKKYQLRFCEACDAQIRAAYLKVHKPRSLRGAGITFGGARWDRSVEIQLPSRGGPDTEVWLTVEGKDGSVHQRGWRMDEISPATARWYAQR